MTEHIRKQRTFFIEEKQHHIHRTLRPDSQLLAKRFQAEGKSDLHRAAECFAWMLEQEQPVVLPGEKIALLRTVASVPEIYTEEEWAKIRSTHTIHELGRVCNINPEYSLLLETGTAAKREELLARKDAFQREGNREQADSLDVLLSCLNAMERFGDRYQQEAAGVGNTLVAESFSIIPRQPPRTFLEALQFLRLLHFCLWCGATYHNTFGRFDQYMYPYYQRDVENGILDDAQALDLVEEFFLSCNRDSDLYPGMQQGDNGQSMVLGGLNPDGSESYNALSDLCLQASLELRLIDPKINLRVNKKTPLALYEKGSQLTKQGLGFPQYSNDDIVIQALLDWGYKEQDAYNYVVAACWEFIVPGAGMDIPNIGGLSFTQAVLEALERLEDDESFDSLLLAVKDRIFSQAEGLLDGTKNLYISPAPFMSLMMRGCAERGRDISLGGNYNNYGFHGTGLSTAVDSLAAVRAYVFEERRFSAAELLELIHSDFAGREEVPPLLRYQGPKMGNDDDSVDGLGVQLLDWFADALEGHRNERGGIFRAGTGSAMYYIWHSKETPATPDGRRKGEALACNYSPSLFSRCRGPVSILKSFSKPHLARVANGGPLTIELHDTMFRNEDSTRKVAMYVKSFFDMGGHQMQINAVNKEQMKDAKLHPDNYRNLIVRVWGWSGYFVELDEVYQDHIIERMELSV